MMRQQNRPGPGGQGAVAGERGADHQPGGGGGPDGDAGGFLRRRWRFWTSGGRRPWASRRGTYVTLTMDGLPAGRRTPFARAARAVAEELRGSWREPDRAAGAGGGAGQPGHHPRRHRPQGPRAHPGHPPPGGAAAGALRRLPAGGLPGRRGAGHHGDGERGAGPGGVPRAEARLRGRSGRPGLPVLERLCRTVQLSDTGIAPGSGVGNHRWALDRETLGVPVLAVGVPTVVDAATLAADLLGQEELPRSGTGAGPAGHPQGHRQPGGRPRQGHRLRNRAWPSSRGWSGGPGTCF